MKLEIRDQLACQALQELQGHLDLLEQLELVGHQEHQVRPVCQGRWVSPGQQDLMETAATLVHQAATELRDREDPVVKRDCRVRPEWLGHQGHRDGMEFLDPQVHLALLERLELAVLQDGPVPMEQLDHRAVTVPLELLEELEPLVLLGLLVYKVLLVTAELKALSAAWVCILSPVSLLNLLRLSETSAIGLLQKHVYLL